MQLKSVNISNYRSIEQACFEIKPLRDGTFTYGLIGVNEAGKSTILKALALKDGLLDAQGNKLPTKKDYKDKMQSIEIQYDYILEKEDISECKDLLNSQPTPIDVKSHDLKNIRVTVYYIFANPNQSNIELDITNIDDENENKSIIQDLIEQLILGKMHRAIFWTAEDRYLISQPINLAQFAARPDDISIPLKNCFLLAGIDNIQDRISDIATDSTEVEQLEKELGEKVTEHINNVWPKHPILITFKIGEGLINFHVKDCGAVGKAKTADQRSDGFKQFVSFLLTISAQNKNDQLSDTVLLLDEPETHLHPQAQEELLMELIKITNNKRNNIVFFATHSNYMIDKNNLSRNYKVKKDVDNTEIEKFSEKISTYASVSYEVFGIASTDYHNELYGFLEENKREELNKLKKDKKWKNAKTGKDEQVSLATYIRHSIHHPENKLNKMFTKNELIQSIEILNELRSKK